MKQYSILLTILYYIYFVVLFFRFFPKYVNWEFMPNEVRQNAFYTEKKSEKSQKVPGKLG